MERYFLDNIEVQPPRGIDGLTRQKSRSRRYFSVLYQNMGYANGIGNITFADPASRAILLTARKQSGVSASTRFRFGTDGKTDFDAYINYLTLTHDRTGVTCAFLDDSGTTTLEHQAVTSFRVPTLTPVLLRPKRTAGASTHTVGTVASIVQRATPVAQALSHAVPLLRPDKAESTLPGLLLTVETPLDNSPMYRNRTTDQQALRLSGRVQLDYSASASTTAQLIIRVYSASGDIAMIPQGELLATTTTQSTTVLINASLLVQPGGWITIGFSGSAVQKYVFTYGTDTTIILESVAQAPQSVCRGLLVADLLAALVARSSNYALTFASDYFSTGNGKNLLITSGANLRGINLPLTATLQDVFEGLTASEPLSLWIDGTVVRCEQLLTYLQHHAKVSSFFAEPISVTYKSNTEYIASEVLTGFESWRSGNQLSGDEFNGSRQYLTANTVVRQTMDLRAKTLVASGSLIEEQRRKQFADTTSAKVTTDANDDKLFIISLTTDRTGILTNETRALTPDLSGLIDNETPYNVNLSPRRSLDRWAAVLPLAPLTLESFEGNVSVRSRRMNEVSTVGESDALTDQSSLLSDEQALVSLPMSQSEFNNLGDWITVYDEGLAVTGLLMDATWRATSTEGAKCDMTLFLLR